MINSNSKLIVTAMENTIDFYPLYLTFAISQGQLQHNLDL